MATEIWVAIVGAIAALFGALIGSWSQRKKRDADTAERISAAWEKLIRPYENRLKFLENEYVRLVKENAQLTQRVDQLEKQNLGLVKRNAQLAHRYQVLLNGVRILVRQIQRCDLIPEWDPPADIMDELNDNGDDPE